MSSTKPGFASGLSSQAFGQEERVILNNLASFWRISFIRVDRFKDTEYQYAFLQPTEDLSNKFNLLKEILCLFSPFDRFDARSLDFVDKTIPNYQNRLDKLCVLIVGRDPQLVESVGRHMKETRESRILIPLRYAELSGGARPASQATESRMKELLYTRDLFAFDSPLQTENFFFGRTHDIQLLYGKYQNGENGCLFGLRRIGKTSVLLALRRAMGQKNDPVAYVDCSSPTYHRCAWNQTLFQIKETIFTELGLGSNKGHPSNKYTEQLAARCFQEDLSEIRQLRGGKRILLILDEIENLTFDISPSQQWSSGQDYLFFWQALRSIYQTDPNLFAVIVAGVNPRCLETARVGSADNPIYRFITPNYLQFFELDDVVEMVDHCGRYMGLSFAREVCTYLTDDFGGHPFLIRQVCSAIHRKLAVDQTSRPFSVSKFTYQQRKADLSRGVHEYLELILSTLRERYPPEYELLQYLAHEDQKTFLEFAKSNPAWIEHLKGYGLVVEVSQQFHFRILAVRDLIREKTANPSLPSDPEKRWAEISRRRNSIEVLLRKVVRQVFKANFGSKAREEFLKKIEEKRRERLAQSAFDDVFTSEIYFLDLKISIEEHWPLFQNIFNNDKPRFSNMMDQINRTRGDAHAKDVPTEDLEFTLVAIKWINDRLDAFLR